MMLLCAVCMASAANYLTFMADEDGSTFGIINRDNDPNVQYSLDDGATWTVLTEGDSVVLAKKGDKALLKGNNPEGFSHDYLNCTQFVMSGSISASGSVMSLIDGKGESLTIPNKKCFYYLFSNCESLVQAPELPATHLADSCYANMFYFCTNLEKAPELPATELAEYCYFATFACCRKMVDVPQLPASVMVKGCYNSMFLGCYSLKRAPELPSTELANSCYANMFAYCIGLEKAPELPATVVVDSCYLCMFSRCDSLTQAPALPATELAYRCYYSMFDYCVSLEVAPELPATTLAEQCYYNMFSECFSLKKAPELPATELVKGCYTFMFNDCTSLSEVKAHFTSWEYVSYTYWLSAVAPQGTFYCPEELVRDTFPSDIPYRWVVKYYEGVDTTANYLTFTAEEDGSSFMAAYYNDKLPNIWYSKDGGESWTALMYGDSIALPKKGDQVLLSGYNPSGLSQSYVSYSTFMMTGKIAASGSVMSLIDGKGLSTEIPNGYCFCKLFKDCSSLTQAPELPATTLANACYYEMFAGCTGLTQAPELPATTMAESCYYKMFLDCTGLTKAPELPATTLASSCYCQMFNGCANLSEIKVSFSEWSSGTASWVKDVAPTGTFTGPYALNQLYGENCIPKDWTVKYLEGDANYLTFTAEEDSSTFGIVHENGNTPNIQYSLDEGKTWRTLSPDKPISLAKKGDKALLKGKNPSGFSNRLGLYSHFTMTGKIAASGSVMSLVDGLGITNTVPGEGCFYLLFYGCSAMTQAPELPAMELSEFCYHYMFHGCSNLTKAPELPATTLSKFCYSGMFKGCAGFTQTPVLHATTLASGCYSDMFSSCTGLKKVLDLPADTLADYCYENMFVRCTNLTEVPALPAMTLAESCYSEMFYGCTNLTKAPALPATNLAYGCYESMFEGCVNLTEAPELPATKLAEACYQYMFMKCEKLEKAPALPALVLSNMCYNEMFSGCINLSEIKVFIVDWILDGAYGNTTSAWVYNVAPTGTFICPKALSLEYGESRIPEGWTVRYVDDTAVVRINYLTFTSWEEDSSVKLLNKNGNTPNVEYSTNGGKTWMTLVPGDSILMDICDKVMLRGYNPEGFSQSEDIYSSFSITGIITPKGSVMSLVDGKGETSVIPNEYCFYRLFEGCNTFTAAPSLPATTLKKGCYKYMFKGCSNMAQAPELPATDLTEECYYGMFEDCTGFTKAPNLPATTLAEDCYKEMFHGCSNLSEISVSFVDWAASRSTLDWVVDVASTGTFICPKALPIEYGEDRIPNGWMVKYIEDASNCLTLTAEEDNVSVAVTESEQDGGDIQPAPYSQHSDDSSIASVDGETSPVGRRTLPPMSTDLKYSTDGGVTWTEMVPGTPITLEKKGDKILFKGNNPSGFSTETQRIQFDIEGKISASGSVMSLIDETGTATTIPNEYCFANLFENCAGLTKMPYLSATELKAYCYKDMFRGCTSLRSTTDLPATTLEEGSYEEMFYDCENLSEVAVSFSDWTDGTKDWLHGVASTGKVFSLYNLAPNVGDDYVPVGWMLVTDTITKSADNVFADDIIVWTQDYTIYVKGAKGEISLYDPTGKILLISNSSAEEIRTLKVSSKGVYIVKTKEKSLIAVVR